ncbi:DUF1989 domain-containing protein [Pseudaestuariivita atlantica]|uniref:Aminomethyltransferase n=1 Tax=Pseudaestuariivita atlantica TaxID=1317121 RepID=A0A0L1JT75_9RHOB|nr:aminomethyltransferase family protein [Pseudaestuariivita atlantica]KNG94940.1 aminomethyltransferase [Pseudaestuariivita atlantica]
MLEHLSTKPLPRRVYRGLKDRDVLRREVTWGGSSFVRVPRDAIISITNVGGGAPCWVTTLSDTAPTATPKALDLAGATARLDPARFDARQLAARLAARGASLDTVRIAPIFDASTEPGAHFVTRATEDTTLCIIAPIAPEYVITGGGSSFAVEVKLPASAGPDALLPEPMGRVVEEWRIDRATARAYTVKAGQFIQVIDVEGQQCSDFMAMRASALDAGIERFIDSTVTRTKARSAYPLPGLFDKFYDQDIRPLLAVRQDTVGRHDTFALACTANGYEERGFPGHINCSDNISDAYAPYGIGARPAWPAINFFFNSWIDAGHHGLASDEAWSRAGDYVVMQALTDLVCVSTACPDDVDPINGWNPTDIHLRIYEADSPITHAVTWRAQPDEAGQMTRHSAFHPRTSALTRSFDVARDMWMPRHYDATGAVGEYWACRRAATLQDMSGLRKYDIVGPDAEALLQACLTRDVSKLAQHRGLYALICDARGQVLDDGTLFRIEPHVFRWCCGSDESGLHLAEEAARLGLSVHVRALGTKMANLALQGPASRDILREVCTIQPSRPALDAVKWFGFTIARIGGPQGPAVMLCRTGFTGELGYEVFCDESDALAVWDALIQAGAPHGMVPMGGHALDMLRIEAGLMIMGAEFGPGADALESGLGFAVDFRKEAFIGRDALQRNAQAERRRLVGLMLTGAEPPVHGDPVFDGRIEIGTVTSGCHSPQLGHAIAMARVPVELSEPGTVLEIGRLDGHLKRLPATVTTLPFLDPKREKARA